MLRQIRVLAGSSGGAMRRVWAVINDDCIERIVPFMGARPARYAVCVPDGSGRVEDVDVNYIRTRNGNEIMMHPDDARRFFPDLRVGGFTPEDLARERGEISNEEPEPASQGDEEIPDPVLFQTVPFQFPNVSTASTAPTDSGATAPLSRPARDPLDPDDEPY